MADPERGIDPDDPQLREILRYAQDAARVLKAREPRDDAAAAALSPPPRFVVTLVHGTFVRHGKAAWVGANGPLATALRNRLGAVLLPDAPFGWSGKNTVEARTVAAKALVGHLEGLLREHEDAHHVVVAHSHGGSVAFAALRDPALAGRLLGVVTLGTPFVSGRVVENRPPLRFAESLVACLFAGVAVYCLGIVLGHGRAWWTYGVITVPAVGAALALGAGLCKVMQLKATAFVAQMPKTALRDEQVAIVRTTADEAAAALFAARVASGLVWLLWTRVVGPIRDRLESVLEAIDYFGLRELDRTIEKRWADDRPAPRVAAPSPSLPPGLAWAGQPEWTRHVPPMTEPESPWRTAIAQVGAIVPAVLPVLFSSLETGRAWERWLGMALILAYGVPPLVVLLISVATIPFGLVFALGRFPSGWTLPLAGHYLDISVEPAPPGSWSVTHFDVAGDRLSHGLAHDDPRVIDFVGDWIERRAAAVEKSPPGSSDR